MQFVPKPYVSITQTQNLQWNHHLHTCNRQVMCVYHGTLTFKKQHCCYTHSMEL